MFEFDIFREEVLKDYNSKKDHNLLASKLEAPSPANLRNYALQLYHLGLSSDDAAIFQAYFNATNKYEDLEKAIKKFDLGKLKSIQNFLTGATKLPDEEIVKLVAVLINFKPRPFQEWRENWKKENATPAVDENSALPLHEPLKVADHAALNQSTNTSIKINSSPRNIAIGTSILLALGTMTFVGVNQLKSDGCMYWNGENYVAIDCQSKMNNIELLLVNEDDLKNFRKITRTDTLTEKQVNKVWYSKIDEQVEFFTQSGNHPVERERILKPATWYMIKKYRNSRVEKE